MAPRSPDRRSILLLHVQRTGGISLQRRLRTRFDESDCLMFVHGLSGARDPSGFGFIEGHVGLPYARRFRRWPFVVACLRDPIERAVSHYHLLRQESPAEQAFIAAVMPPEMTANRLAKVDKVRRYGLGELLAREPELAAELLGNRQAWALSDPQPSPAAAGLEEACRNLERCDLVLLTERLDEAIDWLGQRLGCGPLGPMPRDNPTRGRPAVADLDRRTRDALAELTAVDRALHEFAVGLYERRLREWRAAGSPPEPTLDWDPPPSARDFSFDQAVHGCGWQPREAVGGRWICWIGAERQAWIDLTVEAEGDHRLRCEVAHVLKPAILRGVRLRLDGTPVELTAHLDEGTVELRARVPGTLIGRSPRTVRLLFSLDETARPVDINPASADRRQLGVAFGRIRLQPAWAG